MAKLLSRLSPAESEIMRHLWDLQEVRVNELLDACNAERDESITRNTLLVQLERLEAKGWVKRSRDQRAHVFMPAVPRKEGLRHATREFLDRFFGGALTPLLAHCVDEEKLGKKEISDLRALLDEAEAKASSRKKS
ncbi:putative transcriptional regulator [Roseimicrobium gellanilyticum]|uniref:Putative transcriptional regulator n=1 Tax=Roseimicrobium gellanilyticum TaxID=748857 RepID=A0A366HQR2_9BACT|nr:BlaI/MecI/CopY family transcriptional regulator [Roseimicrobium gellanilyticum]RBP46001.1 putative transcriptional regulator [Roseimicrobium gellanilyticum]